MTVINMNTARTVTSAIGKHTQPIAKHLTTAANAVSETAQTVSQKIGKKEYVEFFKKVLGQAKELGSTAWTYIKQYAGIAWEAMKSGFEAIMKMVSKKH